MHVLGLLLFAVINTADGFSQTSNQRLSRDNDRSIVYRRGQADDRLKIVMTDLVNPSEIEPDRLVVATVSGGDKARNKRIIGWAQLKPIGYAPRDPSRYNARPGSYDLEDDVDDQMWEEFEQDDTIKVPSGLSSLPWTKEYRAMERAVQFRSQRREAIRAQRRQEMMSQKQRLWELSMSNKILEPHCEQDIKEELIRRVFMQLRVQDASQVYVKARKASDVDWYCDTLGFSVVAENDIPAAMALDITVGNALTKFLNPEETWLVLQGSSETMDIFDNIDGSE